METKGEIHFQKIWVILPTYQEAGNLPILLDRLIATGLDLNILIIDDNSPDGTGDIAEAYSRTHPNISLLRRTSMRGLGSAYLAGFGHAIDEDVDILVTMDSDLSHIPEALPGLITALGDAGCLVGSRYTQGGRIENWPAHRRWLSSAANHFVRNLFNTSVKDCTSGYRIYRRQVIDDILKVSPRSQGYSFQVEALLIALSGDMDVRETPICFVERVNGESKMGFNEVIHGAKALLSLWFSFILKKIGRAKSI